MSKIEQLIWHWQCDTSLDLVT